MNLVTQSLATLNIPRATLARQRLSIGSGGVSSTVSSARWIKASAALTRSKGGSPHLPHREVCVYTIKVNRLGAQWPLLQTLLKIKR